MLDQKPNDIVPIIARQIGFDITIITFSTFKSYNNHLEERAPTLFDNIIMKITKSDVLIQGRFVA